MYLKNVEFITSAPNKNYWIYDDKKEFVILGRSNVGKSTFINQLTNTKTIARVSSAPGRTRLLNFFDVDDKFRIVDAPGYGYSVASQRDDKLFATMMNQYLSERKNLVCALLLLDSRRIPNDDDVQIFQVLVERKIPYIIIATKYDKLNQSGRSLVKTVISKTLGLPEDTHIITSSVGKNKSWIDEVITLLNSYIA